MSAPNSFTALPTHPSAAAPRPTIGPLLAALAALAALAVVPGAVRAQTQTAEGGKLTLREVVEATLSRSTRIRAGAEQVEAQRGQLMTAGGQFDPQVRMSLASGRDNTLSGSVTGQPSFVSATTDRVTYGAGLDKQFRSGLLISPQVGLTRTELSTVPGLATSRATANLNVVLPLMKDRGGGMSAAGERAASGEFEASRLELRHATSESVLEAAVAYWNYVAAAKRRDVYASTESRARRMADQTKVLVDREERTPAELKQTLANLAAKRVTRIGAEQAVIEARQQLGLVMGLGVGEIAALPEAADEFLAPHDSVALEPDRLAADALSHRADLAAMGEEVEAAQVMRRAARGDLRPRLDLVVDLGYVGIEQGTGVGQFFAPLYRNVPGANASVQLRYQIPTTNAAAHGRALQAAAVYEQQRVTQADLERRIRSEVLVAVEALRHNTLALTQAQEAVELSRASVESEQKKFQLGMSTLFDVIQAEDALTNALLSEIAAQRAYAVALVTLRHQTGTLLEPGERRPVVDPDNLITPP